jgi:DNA-binding GntR family transcriptional regulator
VRPRQLIRDRAHQAIQEAILDGTFQPGEVLDDARLQEWLQISRTPIRQALYALSIEGLIDMAPQAHTRVVLPRREDTVAYVQATGVLMVGVTELVAEVATEVQRGQLVDVLHEVIAAAKEQHTAAFVDGLGRYFKRLNELNPNAVLAQLCSQAMVAFGYHLSVVVREWEVPWHEVAPQHEILLAGWGAGDPETTVMITKRIFGLRGRWANNWDANVVGPV